MAELVLQVHHCLLPFSWKCWKWCQAWHCSMSEIWIQSKCHIMLPHKLAQGFETTCLTRSATCSCCVLMLTCQDSICFLLPCFAWLQKFCCGMFGSISLVTGHIGSTMLRIPPHWPRSVYKNHFQIVPIMNMRKHTWFKNITTHNDSIILHENTRKQMARLPNTTRCGYWGMLNMEGVPVPRAPPFPAMGCLQTCKN